jgi:mannose-6-phosphate isomerase
MTFARVTMDALGAVCALFEAAVHDMQARGLMQWTWGKYPREDILREDIERGQLWRVDTAEGLVAVFALVRGQGEEYADIPWRYGVDPACLHRVALQPEKSGRGVGKAIVAFAMDEARRMGCDCFRVDTYGQNARARKLFSDTTEREAGTFRFPRFEDDFHCFESPLTDDCPLLPFRMHPAYRHGDMTPWGGERLKTLYGKDIPDSRTGEALEISCIDGLASVDDAGETLPALIARHGARLTGAGHEHPFPLLLKLLDAKSSLSVQVHPNDAYAMAHEGKLGKTEAWVILHAEAGAELCYGLKDGVTLTMLRAALIGGQDVAPMIAAVQVAAGDVLYMPSGMVHAIGGGITLYEIQQSSDVTYRLWDFNRTNEQGEKRELHVEKSLDVIDPTLAGLRATLPDAAAVGVHTVLDVAAFTLRCACVQGELALAANRESFTMFTALEELVIAWPNGQLKVKAGGSALIPAAAPQVTLKGMGRALLASAGA